MHIYYFVSRSREGLVCGAALVATLLMPSVGVADQTQADVSAMSAESVLTLTQAVRVAQRRSALVRSFGSDRAAAQLLAGSANALPDPVVSAGLSNWPISGSARFKLDEQLPTAVFVGVSRKLTRQDKRAAATQKFESQADLADAQAALVLAQLSRETATAWLDRTITRKQRDLTIARLEENQRLLGSAEAGFRSGRESQTTVFDARLAIERNRDQLDEVDRELAIATARLARWVGEVAEQVPGEMPALVWQASKTASNNDLTHPELALAQAKINVNEAQVRVTETAQRSDWTVGLSYGRRGSVFGDAISLQVSIPWQLNRKTVQTEQWLASRERVTASQLQHEELMRSEASRIESLAASLRFLNKRIARYQFRMLPIAEQRAEASLAAYSGGSATLSSVLMARRAQLDLQLEEIALERRAARVWAELEYLDLSGFVEPAALQQEKVQ